MKIFLFPLLSIFICSCSGLKYLDAFDGLKAKPKEVQTIYFEVRFDDTTKIETIDYIDKTFYDSKGRRTKMLHFDKNGIPITSGWRYNYDGNGNETEVILLDSIGNIIVQNKYTYNAHGQRIKSEHISHRKKSVTDFVINRKNRTIEVFGKKSDGSFKEQSFQKYDRKWQCIESTAYDSIGRFKSRVEFEYDNYGNQITFKRFNKSNELFEFYNSRYDSMNNRILDENYVIDKDGNIKLNNSFITEYVYNKNGNFISETILKDEKIHSITKYKFIGFY